jgi:putative tricarboxylic transport membrane protein
MADDTRAASHRATGRRGLIRAPRDFAAGLSLVALALFALWAGADLEQGTLRAMGPGMLPRGVAVLVALVGVALAVTACLQEGEGLERWSLRGPFFVCLGVLAFAATIRTVGLVLAGPLVALVSAAASPETRFGEILVFAVVITAFCVGLFKYALNLPIPVLVIPGVVVL